MKKRGGVIPQRGEVVLVNFDPSIGAEIKKIRPALILQNNIANTYGAVTIVAAITSHSKGEQCYPTEIFISTPEGGLEQNSVVVLNQIRTIDKQRLIKKLGRLDGETMKRVNIALRLALGMGEF